MNLNFKAVANDADLQTIEVSELDRSNMAAIAWSKRRVTRMLH